MESGVVERIRAAGGEVYGITSEPQHLANQAREHWELDFETVGDPHQEIAQTCSARGWLTLFSNQGGIEFLQRGASWKVEHPKGFLQPGVLALTSRGRVLYRWRSVPSAENLNGTVARPTAEHVFRRIERSLEAGPEAGDAAHDDHPEIDQKAPPRLLFIAMLLANGGFLGVRSFAYSPEARPLRERMAIAGLRLVLFVAAWIAAAAYLPSWLVTVAFAAWFVWVYRDIRRVLGRGQSPREIEAGP